MKIVEHASIEEHALPGLMHRTVAGPRDGVSAMEVWMQTIAPGSATPMHRHDCEEVIVILRGSGTCEILGEREPRSFGPGSTLILYPNEVHQITNTGADEMWLVASLSMAPVRVEAPDGARIALPWDQSPEASDAPAG